MIVLTTPANEQSVYWVTIEFLDEDNNAMAPDVATWTLTDLAGNIINSRQDISIATPQTEETIEVAGDDLAVDGNDIVSRLITAEGTYTSVNHGANKQFKFQILFPIEPIIIV